MSLLDEAIAWLAGIGLDQWQGNRERQRRHVLTDVDAGTLYVVERAGRSVATITVDELADTDFWYHDDEPLDALYVHRMAVARAEAGQRLGSAMLDWAAHRAELSRRGWLRLDAWRTNGALHVYYKNLDFEHLRTETVDGRGSGALFERFAGHRRGGPALVEVRRRGVH